MVKELESLLIQHKNEEYALKMKAYMKGKFEYYGIRAPKRKELTKPYIKAHKNTEWNEIKSIVDDLWDSPYRDGQYIGMDLLSKHLKKLEEDDLLFLQNLITSKSWWDSVDWLASHAVGSYFNMYPQNKYEVIEKWMDSENLWLKRASIIHQLFYKNKTDRDLLAALIIDQKGSKEFFINKACGWALRQYSRTNPTWVEEFVEEHHSELSNLTIKEGMRLIEKNKK